MVAPGKRDLLLRKYRILVLAYGIRALRYRRSRHQPDCRTAFHLLPGCLSRTDLLDDGKSDRCFLRCTRRIGSPEGISVIRGTIESRDIFPGNDVSCQHPAVARFQWDLFHPDRTYTVCQKLHRLFPIHHLLLSLPEDQPSGICKSSKDSSSLRSSE